MDRLSFRIKKNDILIISGWCLVILTALLLFFKITLTSDSLFMEDLTRNFFLEGGHWSSWKFPPAPAYLPDMILYFIAFPLFSFPVEKILFVSVIQAILVAMCVLFLAKKIKPDLSALAKTALLVLVALTTLVSIHSRMWLYFNTTNIHVGSFLFSLLALALLIEYLKSQRANILMILMLIVVAAIICDKLFILSFYITAIVLIGFLLICSRYLKPLQQYQSYKKAMILCLISMLVAYPIASIVGLFITYNNPTAGRIPITFNGLHHSWHIFVKASINIFYPINIAVWIYTGVILLALLNYFFVVIKLFLSWCTFIKDNVLIKNQMQKVCIGAYCRHLFDSSYLFFLLFLMFLIPINVAGSIFSGGFADIYGYRYFMLPIALALILMVVFLDKKSNSNKYIFASIVYIGLFSVFAASIWTLHEKLAKNGWQAIQVIARNGVKTNIDETQVAACVQDVSKKETLTAGIADYWLARGVSYQLPVYIPITTVTEGLKPDFWMTSFPMLRLYKNKKYNFIILSKKCNHQITALCLPQNWDLPTGYKRYNCNNAPAEIWVYPNDILNNFLQNQFSLSLFIERWISSWTSPIIGLRNGVGTIQNGISYANANHDKAGFLARSSTMLLSPGYYKITVYYHVTGISANKPVGTLSVGFFNAPIKKQLLVDKVLSSDKTKVSIKFHINKTTYAVQARIWYAGYGSLSITKIQAKLAS